MISIHTECKSIAPLLWDYSEGKLDDRDRLRVDSHLGACSACGTALDGIRRTVRMVRVDTEFCPGVPNPNWAGVADRLAQQQVTQTRWFSTRTGSVVLAVAACSFAVLLFIRGSAHRNHPGNGGKLDS